MKFLVYGAGAIGTYLGATLLAAGHNVTFLVRPQTAEVLRQTGVCLGSAAFRPVIATSPAEGLADAPNAILFALKAYDTAAALAELWAATATPPPIVCLQNGIGNEDRIVDLFGKNSVVAGTITTAVSKSAVGQVIVERERGVGLALGHPLSLTLAEVLTWAGLKVQTYANAAAMKWSKLLTNLIGNATSAILDMAVAEVYAHPLAFQLEQRMLRECLAVMRAQQLPVVDLPRTPVRALAFAVERLPGWLAQPLLQRAVHAGRGGKRPSFHGDVMAGRSQTEVRWLNGAVVRYGAQLNLPVPVNTLLTDTLEQITAGRLARDAMRQQPEALFQLIK